MDFMSDLGRRITQRPCVTTARAPSSFSDFTFQFDATMRLLSWVPSPTQPRGRNVAVPAFILVFGSVSALGIYNTEGKKTIVRETTFMFSYYQRLCKRGTKAVSFQNTLTAG